MASKIFREVTILSVKTVNGKRQYTIEDPERDHPVTAVETEKPCYPFGKHDIGTHSRMIGYQYKCEKK